MRAWVQIPVMAGSRCGCEHLTLILAQKKQKTDPLVVLHGEKQVSSPTTHHNIGEVIKTDLGSISAIRFIV